MLMNFVFMKASLIPYKVECFTVLHIIGYCLLIVESFLEKRNIK